MGEQSRLSRWWDALRGRRAPLTREEAEKQRINEQRADWRRDYLELKRRQGRW